MSLKTLSMGIQQERNYECQFNNSDLGLKSGGLQYWGILTCTFLTGQVFIPPHGVWVGYYYYYSLFAQINHMLTLLCVFCLVTVFSARTSPIHVKFGMRCCQCLKQVFYILGIIGHTLWCPHPKMWHFAESLWTVNKPRWECHTVGH